jgi:hypothetical protein
MVGTLLLVGAIISFGLAAFSVPTRRVNTIGLGLLLGTLYLALPLFQ